MSGPAPDPTTSKGPSRTVVAIVALVVGIVMLVVGVLRLLGVGAPPRPVDTQEALDAASEVMRRQQVETDIQAHIQANNSSIDASDSVLVTCTPTDSVTFSCTVIVTGNGMRTDVVTARMGATGTWVPVGP